MHLFIYILRYPSPMIDIHVIYVRSVVSIDSSNNKCIPQRVHFTPLLIHYSSEIVVDLHSAERVTVIDAGVVDPD